MKSNRLLDLFHSGQGAVAGWMSLDSAYAAELVGASGFDAVGTRWKPSPPWRSSTDCSSAPVIWASHSG